MKYYVMTHDYYQLHTIESCYNITPDSKLWGQIADRLVKDITGDLNFWLACHDMHWREVWIKEFDGEGWIQMPLEQVTRVSIDSVSKEVRNQLVDVLLIKRVNDLVEKIDGRWFRR